MKRITLEVSDQLYEGLQVLKEETWKELFLLALIGRLKRSLITGSRIGVEGTKRRIQLLQRELGGVPEQEPLVVCPHCFKEWR